VTFLQKNNPLTTPANPLADSARLIVFGKRLSRTQKNPIPVEVEYLPSNPSGNRLEGGSQSFWSSQDSVETVSARFVSRLELVWTQPAEMTVPARPIVKAIDVVGQVGDRQLPVLVDLFLDPLFLQAAEERLGDRIVPAIALPAHTRLEVIRAAESAPRVAAVLRALIGVNQRPAAVDGVSP